MNSLLMTILAPLVLVVTLGAGRAVMCVARPDRGPAPAAHGSRIAAVHHSQRLNPRPSNARIGDWN